MALKSTLEDTKDRLDALLTYANSVTGAEDTSVGDAIETLADGYESGGSTLPIQLELVGTWTGYLPEYTDTATNQSTNTGIFIDSTPYAFLIATLECDGVLDTSDVNNWGGYSVFVIAKLTTGRTTSQNVTYRGAHSLLHADQVQNTNSFSSNGVYFTAGNRTVEIRRKAHETNCPKIMGGNYTVKVYGIVGI